MTGQHLQEQGRIRDGPGEGSDLVERTGEGDESVPRDQTVGGFHADESAEGGGLANRSARVRTERDRRHVGCHGRRRTAGRTARHASFVMRVLGGEEITVLGAAAMREGVQVRLGDANSAFGFQLGDSRSLVGRGETLQDIAGRGRFGAENQEVILSDKRHAGQPPDLFAPGDTFVGSLGPLPW